MTYLFTALLVFALGSTALAKQAPRVFDFKASGAPADDICPTSLGLAPNNEVPEEIFPLDNGKFLIYIECTGKSVKGKRGGRVPVIYRYNADSTRDVAFAPRAIRNSVSPRLDCTDKFSVRSPAGDIYFGIACRQRMDNLNLAEQAIYKFTSDGDLDLAFGNDGKILPSSGLSKVTGPYVPPGFLPDGTMVENLCATDEFCTLYNIDTKNGAVLDTLPLFKQSFTNYGGRYLGNLSRGILFETMTPICQGHECYSDGIPGITTGVHSFSDIVNRKPILIPMVSEDRYPKPELLVDDVLFFQFKPNWDPGLIEYASFARNGNKYEAQSLGTSSKALKLIDAFTSEITFNPPTQGVVDAVVKNVTVQTGYSPEVPRLRPDSRIECRGSYAWNGTLLQLCEEQKGSSSGLVLVSLNKDLSLNTQFADQGYLRIKNPFPNEFRTWSYDGRYMAYINYSSVWKHIEFYEL